MFRDKKEKALKKLMKDIRSGFYAYLVLLILEQKEELHGYAIRKELEAMTNGHLVPSEGTLYDILKSLKKYNLVEDFWVHSGGRPRKSYRLTSLGKEVLKELKPEVLEIARIIGGIYVNDGFYISGLLVAIGVLTYLFRNTPNPYIGVRLGYTYLSKEAWREANTFAGVYSIVIGVVIGAITYLLNPPREVLLLLFLIAIGILAVTTYLKAKEAYERAEFRVPLEESPKPLTTANVKPYLMVQLIAVGIYFLIVALLWNKLPEEIAVHYSSNGIPDNFAPKVMGAFVYPLAGFIIMPSFTILISKVPMLIRFPVFGRGQVLTLAFLTIMHLSIVVIVSMSLLYNVGMVGEGWIRWAAMGIVAVTIVWAYWMWKHYKSTPLEE